MNRLGIGVASVALVVLSACGGSEQPAASSAPVAAEASEAPALESVGWMASCESVGQSVVDHLNGGLPTAGDYRKFAAEVEALTNKSKPGESRLLVDVASAGRLSAEVESDPASGPNENLAAMDARLDALDALAEKCAAEGSSALS